MSLNLPTKKIKKNFASHIEIRTRKTSISLTPLTLLGALPLYLLQKLMFKFRKRKLRMWYRKLNKKQLLLLLFVLVILLFLAVNLFGSQNRAVKKRSTIVVHALDTKKRVNVPLSSKSVKSEPSAGQSAQLGPLVGHISHYSKAGCLGCSPSLKMGNGEPLNDEAFTIAVPCERILNGSIKYNTIVRVTNLDNGKSAVAKITDCGGFSKYNRVADLTLAMGNYLETKTDVSVVEVVVLNE